MMQRLSLVTIFLLTQAACSHRGVYEGVQAGNRNDCLMLPPAQYDECMSRSSQSFDDYQRERQEAAEH
jgi:hypothetical protein